MLCKTELLELVLCVSDAAEMDSPFLLALVSLMSALQMGELVFPFRGGEVTFYLCQVFAELSKLLSRISDSACWIVESNP